MNADTRTICGVRPGECVHFACGYQLGLDEAPDSLVRAIANRLRGLVNTNDLPEARRLYEREGLNPLWDAGMLIEREFLKHPEADL